MEGKKVRSSIVHYRKWKGRIVPTSRASKMTGLTNGNGVAMTVEERKQYITRNLQEVLGDDRLDAMLASGGDFNVSVFNQGYTMSW